MLSVIDFVLCLFALISSSTTIFNFRVKIRLVLYNTAASLPALIDYEIVGSRVLSGISLFVVEIFHETIISRRNRGAQKKAQPSKSSGIQETKSRQQKGRSFSPGSATRHYNIQSVSYPDGEGMKVIPTHPPTRRRTTPTQYPPTRERCPCSFPRV